MTAQHEAAVEWLARTMAMEFTSPYGARNPDWDHDGPDDDSNPYHLMLSAEERTNGRSPYIHYTASDGGRSFRAATFHELAPVALTALRDVLAKGGPEAEQVAAALGLTVEGRTLRPCGCSIYRNSLMCCTEQTPTTTERRVVGPWVEVPS